MRLARAGRGRPRIDRDRRPGHPPRGRGHGRRRRARARTRRRTRSVGCTTKSPRSSAPTTTTRCASAACSKTSPVSATHLLVQAEQVRNAITSVHLDLTRTSSVSDMVAEQVNEAAQQITQSLTEKGEHITLALGRAAIHDRRARRARRRPAGAPGAHQPGNQARDRRRQRTPARSSLNFKTDHITEEFEMLTET